jgi:hypothetical protein
MAFGRKKTVQPVKAAARPEPPRALLPSRIASRGEPVVTTQFSMWYWREADATVVRWGRHLEGFVEAGEKAVLFANANTLEGATKIASGREYRRLQAEQRDRERSDAEASTE